MSDNTMLTSDASQELYSEIRKLTGAGPWQEWPPATRYDRIEAMRPDGTTGEMMEWGDDTSDAWAWVDKTVEMIYAGMLGWPEDVPRWRNLERFLKLRKRVILEELKVIETQLGHPA